MSIHVGAPTLVRLVVPETTQTRLVLKSSGLLSGMAVGLFNTATALRRSSINMAGFTAAVHSTYMYSECEAYNVIMIMCVLNM